MFNINLKILDGKNSKISIGAHRGASKECPENTMPAFERALEIGVDHIECDVQLTKDNELVVFHDFTVDRTTNGSGMLMNHTLSELQSLDAGSWFSKEYSGVKLLTLEEVFKKFRHKICLSLELKEIEPRQSFLAKKVVDMITSYRMSDQVQLMSFNHRLLYDIRMLNHELITNVICSARLVDPIRYLKKIKAHVLNVPWYFLSQNLVKEIHKAGFYVCGSLNDDPKILNNFFEWEVDMFDTNIPELMIDARKAQEHKRLSVSPNFLN